jgi:acetoin utilization protein AcuB
MAINWLENGKRKDFVLPQEPVIKSSVDLYQRNSNFNKNLNKKISLAHQLMKSPVKSLPATISLKAAEAFLRENKIRHVPIVDKETNMIEGLLSDRDILRKWAGIDDTFIDWIQKIDKSDILVSECMRTKVLVADPDDRLVDIARVMFLQKIGCMPIVGKELKLVGMITRSDILRMIMSTAPVDFLL